MFNYFVIDEVLFFVHYIDVVSNCLYFHFFPREVVINYGKVCVTFHELGSSLSRTDKVPVHSHVINALAVSFSKIDIPVFHAGITSSLLLE